MLTKEIVARMPAKIVKGSKHLREHMTSEELSVKTSLERVMGRVNFTQDIFDSEIKNAKEKVRAYVGELKNYFSEYLHSIKQVRREREKGINRQREAAGYGPSSCY